MSCAQLTLVELGEIGDDVPEGNARALLQGPVSEIRLLGAALYDPCIVFGGGSDMVRLLLTVAALAETYGDPENVTVAMGRAIVQVNLEQMERIVADGQLEVELEERPASYRVKVMYPTPYGKISVVTHCAALLLRESPLWLER